LIFGEEGLSEISFAKSRFASNTSQCHIDNVHLGNIEDVSIDRLLNVDAEHFSICCTESLQLNVDGFDQRVSALSTKSFTMGITPESIEFNDQWKSAFFYVLQSCPNLQGVVLKYEEDWRIFSYLQVVGLVRWIVDDVLPRLGQKDFKLVINSMIYSTHSHWFTSLPQFIRQLGFTIKNERTIANTFFFEASNNAQSHFQFEWHIAHNE